MAAARVETDFDHHSAAWLACRHANIAELRSRCPVVWNRHYGGFWLVSGYEEVATVARDTQTFSHRFESDAAGGLTYLGTSGIPRPAGLPAIGIGEAEGARHAALRRVINPYMLPSAVAAERPLMERAASWFLDRRITEGRMDMVMDFTNLVPGLWTMRLLDLPPSMAEPYSAYFHSVSAHGSDTPEYQDAVRRTPEMVGEILQIAEKRRSEPGDDLLSRLVCLEIDGGILPPDELIAVLWNLIGGGLDTTTSLTSLALEHLARHGDLRRRLVDDPALLVPACDEYLRWSSVNESLTRTCTRDTELGGQQLRRGDFVMVSWLGANYDPAVFASPAEVDIDRSPNAHMAFGVGPHRCIGLHAARMLFDVMMREVLARIPDYEVDLEGTRFYQGNPLLYGLVRMPVGFTPGPVVGLGRPF